MTGRTRKPLVIVVMGVSGVGKTLVGEMLAARLGWPYYDADDFHPAANIEKMSQGKALTDDDRDGWLEAIRDLIRASIESDRTAVISCSALKESYRKKLAEGDDRVVFLYLKAPRDVVEQRIRGRTGHFFDPALLASQYATLEEPLNGVALDATRPAADIVEEAISRINR